MEHVYVIVFNSTQSPVFSDHFSFAGLWGAGTHSSRHVKGGAHPKQVAMSSDTGRN